MIEDYTWLSSTFKFNSSSNDELIDLRAPVLYEEDNIADFKLFFCGGCEFTYAGSMLRKHGFQVLDTFITKLCSDPIAGFVAGEAVERLNSFNPDMIILSMEQLLRPLLGKISSLNEYKSSEQIKDVDFIIDGLSQSIEEIRKHNPAVSVCILTHITFSDRAFSFFEEASFGNMFEDSMTIRELTKYYDLKLMELARQKSTLLLDVDEIIGKFGKYEPNRNQALLRPHEKVGGHPEHGGARVIASTVLGWAQAIRPRKPKIKLVVLDLDNTLWKGVVREDGLDEVESNINRFRINAITTLAQQGMLIALCSKNDEELTNDIKVILSKFKTFWASVVSVRINWNPKSDNIQSIVDELNIGIDTVAFFDDQPFERAEVKSNLPDVRVFTEHDIMQVVRHVDFMPLTPISQDSKKRATSYINEKARVKVSKSFSKTNYSDFLMNCEFKLKCYKAKNTDAGRISEIVQRTNQQNVTLRRTPLGEVESFIDNLGYDVWCCELSDRFGDYGIIGTFIIDKSSNIYNIIELAFSCRAMGKSLEKAFIQFLSNFYQSEGISNSLVVDIIKTEKNSGMINILNSAGFKEESDKMMLESNTSTDYDRWISWEES